MAVGEYKKFIPQLTRRELEVIEAVLAGSLRYKSIASSLNISVNTVKTHLRKIYLTVGVNNVEALATLFHGYSQNEAEITPKSPSKIAKSPQMGDRKQHIFAVIFYNIMHSGGKKMQNLKALRIRTKFAIPLVLVIALAIGFAAGKLVSGNRQTSQEIGMKDETVPKGILVNFKEALTEVLAVQYSYNANGELLGYCEYEHDSKGNMIKFHNYNENEELSGYSEIERDSKGILTKASHYYANGEFFSSTSVEYDSEGNKTKDNHYLNANAEFSSTVYEYDLKGNQTKGSEYTANGELLAYSEYEYDSNGNWIKWNFYNADGELSFKVECEYDSNGNRTKWSQYTANGELSGYAEYAYDSEEKITKKSDYNANGELYSYTVYLYKKI
jgi:DNA-binding CsgD family transcriptional regulator